MTGAQSIVEAVDRLLESGPGATSASTPGLYFHRSNDVADWRSSLQMDFEHLQPGRELRIQGAWIFIREVHHHRASGYDPESRAPRTLVYDVSSDTVSLLDQNGVRLATSNMLAL